MYVCRSVHYIKGVNYCVFLIIIGVALLHLHMALRLYNTDPDRKRQHLLKASSLLAPSLAKLNTRRDTFLCGSPGPLSIATVVFLYLGKRTEGMDCIEKLVNVYKSQRREFKEIPCEMLYGVAGYLYSLLFVNAHVKDAIPSDVIEEVSGCGFYLDCSRRSFVY